MAGDRPRARTRSRPTLPTGLPTFRTSRASKTTSWNRQKTSPVPMLSCNSGSMPQSGRFSPEHAAPGSSSPTLSGRGTIAFIPIWTLSISRTSRAAASPPIGWTGDRRALPRADDLDAARRSPPRTTCSQIHPTPSGRFLYVGNRAPKQQHRRVRGRCGERAIDALRARRDRGGTQRLLPRPGRQFRFAVGTGSGRLASYRINRRPAC